MTAPPCPVCGRRPPLGCATFNQVRYCYTQDHPASSCLERTVDAWRKGKMLPEERVPPTAAPVAAALPTPVRPRGFDTTDPRALLGPEFEARITRVAERIEQAADRIEQASQEKHMTPHPLHTAS